MRIRCLPRIIHEDSTAAADPGMSAALRSFRAPRRTVEYASGALSRAGGNAPDAPCIHTRLRRLATFLIN
jgi:hypothetical protein